MTKPRIPHLSAQPELPVHPWRDSCLPTARVKNRSLVTTCTSLTHRNPPQIKCSTSWLSPRSRACRSSWQPHSFISPEGFPKISSDRSFCLFSEMYYFSPHHHHLLHRKLSVSGLLSQPPFQARRPSTEVEDALEGHEHSLGVTVLPFHSPGSSAEMG